MASEVSKPNFNFQWASGGAAVAPSDTKIQTGWTAEVPPFQWENWSQNRQDNAILHLFQKGISEWDAASNYYFTAAGVRSYVQGTDGKIYVATSDSINVNPVTDTANTAWKIAFVDSAQLPGIKGSFKNLYASTTGVSAAVTLTADELVVSNSSNIYITLRALNLSANTGAASGVANSLDTGSWAFSTWYARHVIYNLTTSTAALLWSLSKTAPTLPTGYTYSAFTGWERTQSATNFNPLAIQWSGHRGSYIKGSSGNTVSMPIMSSGSIGAPGTPTYSPIAWANFAPPDTWELDLMARAGTPGTSVICAPNNTYGTPGNTTALAPPIAYVPQGAANSPLSIRQWMPIEGANVYYATDDPAFGILQCYGFRIKG